MTGWFTLHDRSRVLEDEDHPTMPAAIARAKTPPWRGQPWQLLAPDGRPVAQGIRQRTPPPVLHAHNGNQ